VRTGRLSDDAAVAGLRTVAPDLVGRDAEVEAITRRVVAAGAGRGGMVLVAGEPGIGKTRLAQEAAELALQLGMRSVWGRCRETGDTPPYWPWTQVLRAVLADLHRADRSSLLLLRFLAAALPGERRQPVRHRHDPGRRRWAQRLRSGAPSAHRPDPGPR
jgi:predicted ATPase